MNAPFEMPKQAGNAAPVKGPKRGPRPCLRCGTEFYSEGIHNRMCGRCRGLCSGEQSVRPLIPTRRFG